MSSANIIRLLLLGALLVPMSAVRGDTIILRNGARIQGRIITQNRILVIINTGGLRRQISKRRIFRIQYDDIIAPPRRKRRRVRAVARKKVRKPSPPKIRRTVPLREKEQPLLAGPWRSALIPGWDRHRSGESLVGGLWLSGFAAGAGLLLNTRNDYVRARAMIEQENNLWNALSMGGDSSLLTLNLLNRRARFQELENKGRRLQTAGLGFALLYLFNLADAFFWGEPASRRLTRNTGRQVRLQNRTRFSLHAHASSWGNEQAGTKIAFEIRLPLGGHP